jgi:hypothetical protein
MHKRITRLTLASLMCAAALTGTALTAHAVNPDSGVFFYFTSQARNASTASKRVNSTARVDTANGCMLDVSSVSPSWVQHFYQLELMGNCLGGAGQQLSKQTWAGGASGAPTSADDLRLACPGSRGDAMQTGVLILN